MAAEAGDDGVAELRGEGTAEDTENLDLDADGIDVVEEVEEASHASSSPSSSSSSSTTRAPPTVAQTNEGVVVATTVPDGIMALTQDSARAVREAMERTADTARLTDKRISLVSFQDSETPAEREVAFIYWVNAENFSGRRISLDHLNRIITIFAFKVPLVTMVPASVRVIIADVGTTMIVCTEESRPDMPEWCLTVRRREDALLFQGPRVGAPRRDARDKCVACQVMKRRVVGIEAGADLFICPICVLSWHRACVLEYGNWFGIHDEFPSCPACGLAPVLG